MQEHTVLIVDDEELLRDTLALISGPSTGINHLLAMLNSLNFDV